MTLGSVMGDWYIKNISVRFLSIFLDGISHRKSGKIYPDSLTDRQ